MVDEPEKVAPATEQQRFQDSARVAARLLEKGALELATAATRANKLGDVFACGGLHMLRDALFRQIELIEEEIAAVDARLGEAECDG